MREPAGSRGACASLGDVLFLLCAAVILALTAGVAASPARFSGDEADFMSAARMGLVENYLESSSMSFVGLARIGIAALRDKTARADLSEQIRRKPDVSLFRHFHPPLLFDWLILSRGIFGPDERRLRWAGVTFHLLTFATVYLGALWLWGANARVAAALASSLSLFSLTGIRTSLGISVHSLYAWLALLALLAMAGMMVTAERKYFLASAVLSALALCAMAYYAAFLFLTLAVCASFRRRELFGGGKMAAVRLSAKAVALSLLIVALVWPAGVFKLTALKPFALGVYLALFRQGTALASVGLWTLWSGRFTRSTVEFSIVAACLLAGLYLLRDIGTRRAVLPLLLYSVVVLLISRAAADPTAQGGVVDTVRYLASALPPLFITGGYAIALALRRLSPAVRWACCALLFALLLVHARSFVYGRAAGLQANRQGDAIALLQRHRAGIRSVLVPQHMVPDINYYLPGLRVLSYALESAPADVAKRLNASDADAVVVPEVSDGQVRGLIERQGPVRRLLAPNKLVIYFLEKPRPAAGAGGPTPAALNHVRCRPPGAKTNAGAL